MEADINLEDRVLRTNLKAYENLVDEFMFRFPR